MDWCKLQEDKRSAHFLQIQQLKWSLQSCMAVRCSIIQDAQFAIHCNQLLAAFYQLLDFEGFEINKINVNIKRPLIWYRLLMQRQTDRIMWVAYTTLVHNIACLKAIIRVSKNVEAMFCNLKQKWMIRVWNLLVLSGCYGKHTQTMLVAGNTTRQNDATSTKK